MIYEQILKKRLDGKKQIALLIDPDKTDPAGLTGLLTSVNKTPPDLIFVGGSLISEKTDETVKMIKDSVDIPVLLFPGSSIQISSFADGILFLSLLSGRNPEFLISHHVSSAPLLKSSGMEVISTGYILIDGGKVSSVEYMSNTKPIPGEKTDLAIATAIAGEMMGMKMLYLEAGSGALNPVPGPMISGVREQTTIPLIVGGGLNSVEKIRDVCNAGADIVVVGNAFEKDPSLLKSFVETVKEQ